MAVQESISPAAISLAAFPKTPEYLIERVWLCATCDEFVCVSGKAPLCEKCTAELEPVLCDCCEEQAVRMNEGLIAGPSVFIPFAVAVEVRCENH